MGNTALAEPATARQVADKGLKSNAISFLSNVVIGVSSTSPAYSLAATIGLIAEYARFGTPAILIAAFIPMILIAAACYQLNRADPDCGTTFSWVTRAMGPRAGWMGGWSIIVTDIIVMPSLASVAADYSFRMMNIDYHAHLFAATLTGVGWIALMTAVCYIGIEVSARAQQIMLAAEVAILVVFAIVALVKVHAGGAPAGSHPVALNWFNPFDFDSLDNFAEAIVLAVFIYWGWDTAVAVNEETKDPGTAPGRAAVVATIGLAGLYVLVAVAAVAFAGPDALASNSDDILAFLGTDVLGPGLGKFLTLAVLTSAVASAQTTILPTARMAVSMAGRGALPSPFGQINPRYKSPGFATLTMGGISIVWYIIITRISMDVLNDSITALGIVIAFYYGLTGVACVIFYRRRLCESVANFCMLGVAPGTGGLIMFALFIKICVFPGKSSLGSTQILGFPGPIFIGAGSLLLGIVLMMLARWRLPGFFATRPEAAARTVAGPKNLKLFADEASRGTLWRAYTLPGTEKKYIGDSFLTENAPTLVSDSGRMHSRRERKGKTMLLVAFRCRIREGAGPELERAGARVYEIASQMPGFGSYKDYTSSGGESISLIEFESPETPRAWREHPEHVEIQRRAREELFTEYHIQVCSVVRDYGFP